MAEVFNDYTGLLLGAEELFDLTESAYGAPWPDALIEDYTSIATSLQSLSKALSGLSSNISNSVMIVGSGSPNGVVESNFSRQYYDVSGSVGSRFYVNPTVGADTGWVAIN